MLYSVSGNAWPDPHVITISFMPDGTQINGQTSNLQSTFNSKPSLYGRWQAQVLRAAQVWAAQTNINFVVVSDNGAPEGSGNYQQGDPGFGDIRIGGYNFGSSTLATTYMPPPVNNFSIAGDIVFNTGQTFNIGQTFDVFTVAMHEFGHALGLYHSSTNPMNAMYPYYDAQKSGLTSDDIAGIENIYSSNQPRSYDAWQAAGYSTSFATAVNLNGWINPNTETVLAPNQSSATPSDAEYYQFNVPQNTNGTFTVTVQSNGLSMFVPKVTVYYCDGTVLGQATALGQWWGTSLTVTVNNAHPNDWDYVVVQGADGSMMSTGAFALAVNFGSGPTPTQPSPMQSIPNGNPLSSGGGQADNPAAGDLYTSSIPIVTGISPDTGLSNVDGVTNDPNLFVTGQALAGSTVAVYANGQLLGTTVTGQGAPAGQQNTPTTWWFDNTAQTLPDGTYQFTATATDDEGGTSAPSNSFSVLVDTQPPAAPLIAGITPDTGASATDGITNANTPTLVGTAAPNSEVVVYQGKRQAGTTFADSQGNWSFTTGTLHDGTYTFTATDTDLAGNTSAVSALETVVIDTQSPHCAEAGVGPARLLAAGFGLRSRSDAGWGGGGGLERRAVPGRRHSDRHGRRRLLRRLHGGRAPQRIGRHRCGPDRPAHVSGPGHRPGR